MIKIKGRCNKKKEYSLSERPTKLLAIISIYIDCATKRKEKFKYKKKIPSYEREC